MDRVLASKLGAKAVDLLLEGKTSRVVGVRDNKVIDMDIDEALAMKRVFDIDLYKMAQTINK